METIIFFLVFVGLMFAIMAFGGNYGLNGIKSKTVGDGQYGTARFATPKEINEAYEKVPYEPELWRKGKNLPKSAGFIVGMEESITSKKPFDSEPLKDKRNKNYALVDTDDVHALIMASSGMGKTTGLLYQNLEYACALGLPFMTTDTKGDLFKNYGSVAKKYYDYKNIAVIDLRNPMESDGFNLLNTLNKHMDAALLATDKREVISYRAKAEKYAKIIAQTIIYSSGVNESFGQNQFFFDAAEGLITSTILLISEFGDPEERHIVSVFKLIQDLLEPSKENKQESKFKTLLNKLPSEHKARMFAGSALSSADQQMQSVMSTAMSRLLVFLDSEMEQILCSSTTIDAESFCEGKSAIFIVLPEEDTTKYPIASMIIQQYYREILVFADSQSNNRLPKKIMFYLDELGTMPKIPSIEMMFSALRSRNAGIMAIIQSFAQFEKTYEATGCEIIVDNCQLNIFGGFAPNSKTAKTLSENMGEKTVLVGSVSKQRFDNPSAQLNMTGRALMMPDELKTMKRGNIIVQKTGHNPMKTHLKIFFKCGIKFDEVYKPPKREIKFIHYIDIPTLTDKINRKFNLNKVTNQRIPSNRKSGERLNDAMTNMNVPLQKRGSGLARTFKDSTLKRFVESPNHMERKPINSTLNKDK